MNNRIANKVLLIGWDAADWQHIMPLLDAGLLPGLESLINRGVMGNLATLHPVLSPMLWNSIATGKTADKHGILGFTEPLPSGKGIRPFASTSRKVKALWNICHQNGLRSNVVGWWASHPAEPINGNVVSNLFNGLKKSEQGNMKITPGTFHPAEQADQWSELKIHPNEISGKDILPFIPMAAEIDQKVDSRLSTACKLLSDCASIQAMATHLIENEEWDLTAVYFDAIDHFCHAFMYYHPPQMKNVKDRDFEIYKDVIKGAYQFHDMILQRLMYLAGEDTTIVLCSDHGFQSGPLRPITTPAEPAGPAAWHRDLGIVVMAGPGIKRDERIYGANIIDITPTILYQLGLPVGEDMDGRVLMDAFETPIPPETVPSWEEIDGDCGMHPVHANGVSEELTEEQSQALVKQFVALGYIEDPGDDLDRATTNCKLEMDYNLARVFLSTNRFEKAVEVLKQLVDQMPWEDRYWKNLAHCLFELGYFRQAQKIMDTLYHGVDNPPVYSRVFLAKTCFELQEHEKAMEHISVAIALNPRTAMIYVMAAKIQVKANELVAAKQTLEKALELDAENAHALLGIAEIEMKLNRYEEAADAALSAVVILFRLERAHWILGVAMMKLKNWAKAQQAFETLLKFKSTRYDVASHRQLMIVFRQLGNHQLADRHSLMAKTKFNQRKSNKYNKKNRAEHLLDLPSVPDVTERFESHRRERPQPQMTNRKRVVAGSSGRTLTLVSGLPRSGTSLMMQMLQAGGLEPKTDGHRLADENNPTGYLEWEAVKKIHKEPTIFDDEELDFKAVKVISMLVSSVPIVHRYKVIFMNRPIDEVVASQIKMIKRLGDQSGIENSDEICDKLSGHRTRILKWLETRKFIDLLVVDYPSLIESADKEAQRVAEFLGPELIKFPGNMASVVNPNLYREKLVTPESTNRID